MTEINLRVTVDEANLILEGLGQLPFARVYDIVAKLQEQAGRQLEAAAAPGGGQAEVPAAPAAAAAPAEPPEEADGD